MKINYWDCKYSDADEYYGNDDYFWVYGCTHPLNNRNCLLDTSCMYGSTKCNCPLLDIEKPEVLDMSNNQT